nr:MAG TPA: minor tail protein [Caudoviricetes sp.]
MSTTIDSLQIEINSSAQSAQSGIDALAASLDKLANATKNYAGLDALSKKLERFGASIRSIDSTGLKQVGEALNALKGMESIKLSSTLGKQISEIATAAQGINGGTISNLRMLAPALSSLSSVRDVRISSTIGKGVAEIASAASMINVAELSRIAEMSQAIASLANIRDIRISSSLAHQIVELGAAATQLQGVDLSVFGNLAEKLHPLSELDKTANLGTTLAQLKKLPEIMAELDSADLDAFEQNIQRVTTALASLATQMNAVSNGFTNFPRRIQQVAASTQQATTAAGRVGSSYMDMYAAFRMVSSMMRGISGTIAKWITKSNEYIEDVNLFTASLGQYAQKAQDYAEKVGELAGIDPGEWMRAQGIFYNLADGFGIASDRAYTMSQQLTQLSYDLASFYNLSVDDTMLKVRGGLSGEIEMMRQLGVDLSVAAMQERATALGITQKVTAMSQAEKAQLRYLIMMERTTTAQNDMARTLNTPANQLRVLTAQVTQATRALGNAFIPVLNVVLPIAIAAAKAVRLLAASIASLFGYSLPEVDYSGIISDVSAGAGDLSDNLGSAGSNAKKLKKALMGFDEINQFPDASGGGGGGGSGGGGGLGGLNFDLPTYDFLDGLVESRVDAVFNKIKPIVEWMQEHIGEILGLVEAIGASLLLWKVAKTVIPDLGSIRKDLSVLNGFVISGIMIFINAVLTYQFNKKYIETGRAGYLFDDAIANGLSSYLVGKIIANTLHRTAAGQFAAAINLTISAAVGLAAVWNGVVENGVTTETIVSSVWNAIKGAAAGGLIAAATGASVAAGAAIGGVIALTAAAVVLLTATRARVTEESKRTLWGDLHMEKEDIEATAKRLLGNINVEATVKIVDSQIANDTAAKEDLNSKIATFNAGINKVLIGVKIDESERASLVSQLTGEDGLIASLQNSLTQSGKTIELAVSLAPAVDENGNDLSAGILTSFNFASDEIMLAASDAGQRISEALASGYSTGLDSTVDEQTRNLIEWLNNIVNGAQTANATATFNVGLEALLGKIDRASASEILSEYASMKSEYEDMLYKIQKQAKIDAMASLEQLKSSRDYWETIGGNEDKVADLNAKIAEYEQILSDWDIEESVQKALADKFSSGNNTILNAIIDHMFDDSHIESGQWAMDDLIRSWIPESPGTVTEDLLNRYATNLENDFWTHMGKVFNEDDLKILMDLSENMKVSDLNVVAVDVQKEFIQSLREKLGPKNTQAVLNKMGYDMTNLIADGLKSGTVTFEDAGNGMVTAIGGVLDGMVIELTPELQTLFNELGQTLPESLVTGIEGSNADVAGAGANTVEQYKEGIESVEPPKLETAVELVKDKWKNVVDFVHDNQGKGNVVQTIGLTLGSTIKTVATWLATSSVLGGSVEKKVDIAKGDNWDVLPQDSTVDYEVGLKKTWDGSLSSWISDKWNKTFRIDLSKGSGVTWRGITQRFGQELQVKFAKSGGTFKSGEMFIANEAGPELVGRIGNKSAVANEGQIGDAIFRYMDAHGSSGGIDEERFARALVRAMKEAGIGSLYINGREMADAINEESMRTGKPAIVF